MTNQKNNDLLPLVEADQKSTDQETKNQKNHDSTDNAGHKHRPQHSCLKIFSCLTIMLLLVMFCGFLIVLFVVGPITQKIAALPDDFPKELSFYELEKAKITAQLPQERALLVKLIGATPDWVITPLLGFLSTDLKTQIHASWPSVALIDEKYNAANLKEALNQVNSSTKTISLSWTDVDKTKETLAQYYSKKLDEAGFYTKEKISDNKIDLGFWNNGIYGFMSFADNFAQDQNSVINMTVNYLAK